MEIKGNACEETNTLRWQLTGRQKKYLPIKRAIDITLSGSAIVLLSPILGSISLAIKLESPGPVLFKQKRVGKDGKLFEIWKFRSMRIDTPKDTPTHMLSNPEAYITKTGKFIRKTSLDELPQIFNILKGEMSIIGPRPALWNQYDLIEERDKYGANCVTPGLTGWAQINGRDELEIPVKAKYDGDYVKRMSLGMDIKCFFGTIGSVLGSDGVVEGGTGELNKKDEIQKNGTKRTDKVKEEIYIGATVFVSILVIITAGLWAMIHFLRKKDHSSIVNRQPCLKKRRVGKLFAIGSGIELVAIIYSNIKRNIRLADAFVNDQDTLETDETPVYVENMKKKILITGAGSYIGDSVEKWLAKHPNAYEVTTLDMMSDTWSEHDFTKYDVVYHVAGIAHADVGSVTDEQKQLYYKVNTDLAVEVAQKAKSSGVKQFIFMSSMIVYSGCKEKIITKDTAPSPLNFYGDSKWQADQKVRELADDSFKVVVLRPPMIYGKGSKGNYPELAKLACKLPVFPIVKNRRSMLHIDNLCQFVKLMIDNEEQGVFFPQNAEYTNTSDMVQMIAHVKGHRILMIPGMNIAVKLLGHFPGKIGGLAQKAFGDLAYDISMSEYKQNYRVNSLERSIRLTEEGRE